MSTSHLLVAISAHGYGHLSQVVPVINSILERIPDLRLTLRTDLPENVLRTRIHTKFDYQQSNDDFGMIMIDAMSVDRVSSFRRYAELHTDWPKHLASCASEIEDCGADMVLADVPYLTLAAAKTVGIPSFALCSLNWFDIAKSYFPKNEITSEILETMRAAYRAAGIFLQPEPSMPMTWLPNRKAIGPIATCGCKNREVLKKRAGIKESDQAILVAMGGMPMQLNINEWKLTENQHLLVPPGWKTDHSRVHSYVDLGLNFQDLVASSDLIFTKSGYGTIVESAAAGLPVLHLRRPDWPEAPYLERWLDKKVNQMTITYDEYNATTAIEACTELLETGKRPCTEMSGVKDAACLISDSLIEQAEKKTGYFQSIS